jgi:hypothetical protein
MPTPRPADEKLPRYSIPTILALRDKLANRIVPRYTGLSLDGGDVNVFAADLAEQLPKSLQLPVLIDTARQMLGEVLTESFLRDFSWLVAGNLTNLKRGVPAIRWKYPGQAEWVPVQVRRVDPDPTTLKGKQHLVSLRVLAGAASSLIFTKRFADKALPVIARHLGFSRSYGDKPFLSPHQLTSLRFYVYLDPTLARDGRPSFYDIRCPSGCANFNSEILKLRCRTKGHPCPRNFVHDCHQCVVGFSNCLAGTHRLDYYQDNCVGCSSRTWFDPEVSRDRCIVCYRAAAAKPVRVQ